MNQFKKDAYYLLRSFIASLLIFGFSSRLLYELRGTYPFSFSWEACLLILPGLILGLVSATAFHNASHGNIKPRFLNTLIGELTAHFSLEDFRCFKVGHMLHHLHADDPSLDPHPPQGLGFLEFIRASRGKTISCIANLYSKHHGHSGASRWNVRLQIITFHLALVAKILFWFFLFGPTGFVFFYLPAYLAYFFGFAHLNYVSHQDDVGEGAIRNHDGGWFYSPMNFITSGGYYHKNHHSYPGLYNPSRLNK